MCRAAPGERNAQGTGQATNSGRRLCLEPADSLYLYVLAGQAEPCCHCNGRGNLQISGLAAYRWPLRPAAGFFAELPGFPLYRQLCP